MFYLLKLISVICRIFTEDFRFVTSTETISRQCVILSELPIWAQGYNLTSFLPIYCLLIYMTASVKKKIKKDLWVFLIIPVGRKFFSQKVIGKV